jgi:AraC-like DNA-binding protein
MDELTVLPDQSEILHYDDPSFPLYLRRNSLDMYPFKSVLCHWHQEFEFFLVEKGHPSYFVSGTTVSLKEGEGIFINAKCPHYGFSPDGTDSTYLVLVFQPSLLRASSEINEMFVNPLEANKDVPFLVFPPERLTKIKEEMLAMFELLQKKDTGYQLNIMSHLYSFWSAFLSLKGQEKSIAVSPSSQTLLLQLMLAYIYKNYASKISVNDIGQAASISSGYAIHLFSKFLHSSPIAYLMSFRLEKSLEKLEDFTKDISEVAWEAGFESPAYYSEIFKREKGLSPREYRKLLQKSQSQKA